ncbi:cation diffusion facilitator family transporter [Alisedimentitalea sp. MJ-SS2]|uniref:cation diffusion facilitator family transporter n=1 Tax=Aliisedimentitalea sp. MJ-SS2 TaxID=3049795 RepID=UPI00290F74A8|nr:cation diffusion facilitator family transporter [Alisedimentitalea sp. MJ-SS2]MDU8929336.1 cation diffusion facilitator family transporter [Alisedimentitalea sp. MJ-SS2]
MPHDHHHHHLATDPDGDKRVAWAVAVNIVLTLAQIVAGVISGSLALIADAIHNLSDALSLVIAFAARRIARRPADEEMTFGYGRAEVVAALINYTTLIVIALYLAAEGIERLFNPVDVTGWIVVVVAGLALVVDALTALLIFRMSRDSVNMRAAFLHNLADALGSVAVILAGTLILLYDWRLIDPIVTLMISAYILWHSALGIKPVIRILMLGAPNDPDLRDLIAEMEVVQGVANVHHVHLWHMQEHELALEAHVVLAHGAVADTVKRDLKSLLHGTYGIAHSTLEIETTRDACEDPQVIGH